MFREKGKKNVEGRRKGSLLAFSCNILSQTRKKKEKVCDC